MKKILLKIATYIFKKYDVTPILGLSQTIIFQDHVYLITTIDLTSEWGCVDELKIKCHGIPGVNK